MKRLRIMGLCLAATFAICVASAASASAEPPEFIPAGGKFPVAYTSTSSESYFEASGEKIICQNDTNKGELTGPKTDKVTITFFGCKAPSLGHATCQNTLNSGEVVTNPLASTLGYIKKAGPPEVGLSLAPEGGGPFVEFECGGVKVEVGEGKSTEEGGKEGGDSVIGKLAPINRFAMNYTLSFHCVATKQQYEKFEAGPLDVLEAKIGEGPWEEACLNSKDTITFEEKVKLNTGEKEPPPTKLPEFIPAGGKFPVPYTSKSSESYFEASGEKIVCLNDTNLGELTGPKTDKVTITFFGCKAPSLGHAPCQNTLNSGEVVTNPLASTLGYIKKAGPPEVGLSLAPEGGGPFVEFECAGVKVKIGEGKAEEGGKEGGDSVIGKLAPLNRFALKYTLSFNCTVITKKQKYEKFETGPLDVLEAKMGEGPWEEACLNSKDTITFEEKVKLKA